MRIKGKIKKKCIEQKALIWRDRLDSLDSILGRPRFGIKLTFFKKVNTVIV